MQDFTKYVLNQVILLNFEKFKSKIRILIFNFESEKCINEF
jgi:hypothetical protein